jgi:cytochrome c556
MAKGDTPYDAAVAGKAASNIAALSSVLSPDLFPEGSAYGSAADSYALPAIWTNGEDFLAKIADLNTAAAAMQTAAAGDAESVKGGMAALGGACSACHKAYRQPEE